MAVNVPFRKLRHYWPVYFLILVPFLLVATFSYFPIVNGFYHIFFRWDGDTIEEWVGWANLQQALGSKELWRSFGLVFWYIGWNIIKMFLPILVAVSLHHIVSDRWSYIYRVMFIIPMVVPAMVTVLIWKYYYEPNAGLINTFLRATGYLAPTEVIGWLSDKDKIIWALTFEGFPWVGTFGVLIYLAGLQNISEDVYEAAEIDGAGPFRIFRSIELPLIMTQVRINLMLMVIGTVQSMSSAYIYLGENAGPDGVAMVPALLIFRDAFSRGQFGYGCAVGFILFLIILGLTLINNKYVRVKK